MWEISGNFLRCCSSPAQEQIDEEPQRGEQQREQQDGAYEPGVQAVLTAVQIDPAPDEEIEGQKVHPGDGYRGEPRSLRGLDW